MATIQLLQQQAKIIPRYWIDDIYFTGILLHGLTDVGLYSFRHFLKYSLYNFWDLTDNYNLLKILRKYGKYRSIEVVDYYKNSVFVILHTENDDSKEINYESQNYNKRLSESACNNINLMVRNTTRFIEEISLCYSKEKFIHHFHKFCSRLWTHQRPRIVPNNS